MPAAAPLPVTEYRSRTARAQQAMAAQGIAALLLISEPDVRYFTGFLTRFWESPTRPWFLVLPAAGAPVAVIPAIGVDLRGQSWITDIRSWDAPDYADDGVGLLAETLVELVPSGGRIGVPLEPSLVLGPGRMMVQEENIVIREDRVEWLTPRASQDLPELEWEP